MLSNTILALSLLPVSFAHFTLDWPKSRGANEDTAGNFPCGGYNDVQQQRTDFPMSGGPIQLNMGHEQTNVAVYMAVGSNPGDGFSVVMRPQFVVTGLGDFCMGQISVPAGVNVSDGTLASIQVVSNAHTAGGLYQVRVSEHWAYWSRLLEPANQNVLTTHTVHRRDPPQFNSFPIRLQQPLQEQHRHCDFPAEHVWQPQRNVERFHKPKLLRKRRCRLSYKGCCITHEGRFMGHGCRWRSWSCDAVDMMNWNARENCL
jgi:hypothetical protein